MAHEELSPLNITPGAIRFNTDSMKLEYFRIGMEGGNSGSYAGIGTLAAGEWVQITTDTPDIQTGGTRGILFGGYNPNNTYLDEIVYINVATTGNTQDFGLLTVSGRNHVMGSASDRTRGISAGGFDFPSGATADIEYVTIASTGNAIDFGIDLTSTRGSMGGVSNGSRGIFAGGYNPTHTDTIEYLTIQSTGVAVQDFGNLSTPKIYPASVCSPTRGVFCGGRVHPAYYNSIEYIEMSTLGNTADFGDLTGTRAMFANGVTSNSVRGIIFGGYNGSAFVNNVEYINIPSLGNSKDFGDLTSTRGYGSGVSSPTRAVMMGGSEPAATNKMEYVQIMTLGNVVDFGDVHTQSTGWSAGVSNGHGGLG